jgi:hypothetical protein
MEKEGKAGQVCCAGAATKRFKELYGDVQRVARGRRGQSGTESRAKLSKFLLKRCVGRLCFGKIFRLQILAKSGKKLFEGILRDGGSGRASGMMMVARCGGRLLEVLLNGGVVLLCSREVAGFEVGGQLIEGRDEAVGGGRRGEARDIAGLNGVKV